MTPMGEEGVKRECIRRDCRKKFIIRGLIVIVWDM